MKNKSLISYAFLAFPLAFIGLPIYIYLPNFYNRNFNISLQEVATILFFSRLFDAMLDPFIGFFSDRSSALKKKIITFSAIGLGLSVLLLFSPPSFFGIKTTLILSLILTYSLFSIIWINHQSLVVSFSKDYNEKTKIIALRETFFICGIILASILPSILQQFFSETESFKIIGFFYLILVSLAALFFQKFCQFKAEKNHHRIDLKQIFEKKLVRFFSIFFLNSIASSIPASLITFYVATVLNLESKIGVFLIIYFIGIIIGISFWTRISQKLNDKVRTWLISSLVTIAVFPFCYFLGAEDFWPYALICLISGFGFAGDFCINYSILTDIIQEKKLQKIESTIFAALNFLIKISLTATSAALIYYLGVVRDSGNLETEKLYLSLSYALFPLLFKLISTFTLFKFRKKL